MAENSKIEWTKHTWNPWIGCTQVGPACDDCYAMVMMDHRYGRVRWGAGEDRIRTSAHNWNEPRRWNKAAAAAGRIDTVFCLSLGDIWDNEVDPLWRAQAFEVMRQTPNLLYLLLSKRIGNAIKMCDPARHGSGAMLPENAALGATMIDQEEWDRDLPKLKEAARVLGPRFTFASVEPMLGLIDARGELPNWVIVGGESGTKARPMHPTWARSMRDQCAAAGAAYFFKQWGEWLPGTQYNPNHIVLDPDPEQSRFPCMDWNGERYEPSGSMWCDDLSEDASFRIGKKRAGRLLDGAEHSAIPEPAPR